MKLKQLDNSLTLGLNDNYLAITNDQLALRDFGITL